MQISWFFLITKYIGSAVASTGNHCKDDEKKKKKWWAKPYCNNQKTMTFIGKKSWYITFILIHHLDTSHLEHNSLESKWNIRTNFSYSEASKGGSPHHQPNGVLSPPTKRADVIRTIGDRISPTKNVPKRGKSSLIPKPQPSAWEWSQSPLSVLLF